MKLKASLLYEILNNNFPETSKYSKSFLNIKNVIMLENNLKISEIKPETRKKFIELEKKYNLFYLNIPLVIIEKYYNKNINHHPAHIIYFEVPKNDNEEIEFELSVMEVHILLENFFQEVFEIACILADDYNLEIKFKKEYSNDEQQRFS